MEIHAICYFIFKNSEPHELQYMFGKLQGMKLLRRWELLAGTSSNLLIYFITVFNMKSITATTLVNVFNGIASVATLLGAFLTDTYFGRYKTLGYASVSSYLGMLLLTLTATISNLHPPL
ncbi:hypothetical protein ACOSP7_024366 [Xanthoceras sorbifolium]